MVLSPQNPTFSGIIWYQIEAVITMAIVFEVAATPFFTWSGFGIEYSSTLTKSISDILNLGRCSSSNIDGVMAFQNCKPFLEFLDLMASNHQHWCIQAWPQSHDTYARQDWWWHLSSFCPPPFPKEKRGTMECAPSLCPSAAYRNVFFLYFSYDDVRLSVRPKFCGRLTQ